MAELREVASGLQFPEGPIACDDGTVLVVEIARGTLSRVDVESGKVEVAAECGGGPNGAAFGPDGAVYVCNNGGIFDWRDLGGVLIPSQPPPPDWPGHGSIQRVDLSSGAVETLYTECDGHPLRSPNDIVFDANGGFWFTDHGAREDRASDRTGVYYATTDGGSIVEAAFPLDAPNGVGLSPDGNRLYVAETFTGRVWAWTVEGPGQLAKTNPFGAGHGELLCGLPGHQLLDSLAVDAEGWVNVGTLINGGITSISPDGSQVEHLAVDDPLTTNICFGGEDMRMAYITASATGRLLTTEWPRAGLVLS